MDILLAKGRSNAHNLTSLLYACIALCIFLGATCRILTLCALPIAACLAFAIFCINKGKSNVCVCTGIISLLLLQNLCIGIGAHTAGNSDSLLKLLTQIPFMCIAIIWEFSCVLSYPIRLFPNTPIKRARICFMALLFSILISVLWGMGGIMAAAVTTRNLTVFYMAYEIGTIYITDNIDRRRLVKFIIIGAFIALVLGVILQVGGYPLHAALGVHEIYIAKASPFEAGQLDTRFTTKLFGNTFVNRMGSIMFEPINMSYYMALAFVCALLCNPWKGKKRYISIMLTAAGLMLTFGKGGYMIVGLVLGCLIAEYVAKLIPINIIKRNAEIIVLVSAAFAAVSFIFFYYYFISDSIMFHLMGVVNTWHNVLIRPWGYGIGTGGNAARSLNGKEIGIMEWFGSGGETALMSFMYQIGVQGVFFLTLCMIMIAVKMKDSKSLLGRAFFYVPFILIGVSLLQDNTFTPQCIVPFMLMQGALYDTKDNTLLLAE